MTERKAVRILLDSYIGEELEWGCTFTHPYYSALYGKPEFAGIRDQKVCNFEISILTLESKSENEAVVEYKVTLTANNQTIEKYIAGWDMMAERIENLPKRKVPYPDYGLIEMYVDTVDNTTFPIVPDRPEGIKNTVMWLRLEAMLKEPILDLKEKQTIESDVMTVMLRKEEEEWYIEVIDEL